MRKQINKKIKWN